MITAGIIAEFNPLHKGHEYIINKARALTNADCIIIVMSGNFTQRGDIAIAPKHTRAQSAISCGADLVFELPFSYASSSAEIFAQGAVSLLNALKVDYIVFGSESGEISDLTNAANILVKETPEFKQILNTGLSEGLSFPAAREKAFLAAGGQKEIFTPNNILAIEYIKALIKIKASIKPITIKREGAGYNELELSENEGFISASAFRHNIEATPDSARIADFIKHTLPSACGDLLIREYNQTFPIYNNDLMPLLRYCLLMNGDFLCDFADFSPALAERFNNLREKQGNALFSEGYEKLILSLKTKDMTASRIKRALCHALTGFTTVNSKEAMEIALEDTMPYARLLAFNVRGQEFLRLSRKENDLLIITNLGKAQDKLNEAGKQLMYFDILSADIYASVIYNKFRYVYPDEYRINIAPM